MASTISCGEKRSSTWIRPVACSEGPYAAVRRETIRTVYALQQKLEPIWLTEPIQPYVVCDQNRFTAQSFYHALNHFRHIGLGRCPVRCAVLFVLRDCARVLHVFSFGALLGHFRSAPRAGGTGRKALGCRGSILLRRGDCVPGSDPFSGRALVLGSLSLQLRALTLKAQSWYPAPSVA